MLLARKSWIAKWIEITKLKYKMNYLWSWTYAFILILFLWNLIFDSNFVKTVAVMLSKSSCVSHVEQNILKESRDLYINRKVKSRRLFLYFIKNFLLVVCLFNSFYVVSYKLIKHPCQVSCSTGIKKYQKSHFPGDLPCLRLS